MGQCPHEPNLQLTQDHYRQAVEGASESASKCASVRSAQTRKEPHGATAGQADGRENANVCGPMRDSAAQCERMDNTPYTPTGSRTPVSRMRT